MLVIYSITLPPVLVNVIFFVRCRLILAASAIRGAWDSSSRMVDATAYVGLFYLATLSACLFALDLYPQKRVGTALTNCYSPGTELLRRQLEGI